MKHPPPQMIAMVMANKAMFCFYNVVSSVVCSNLLEPYTLCVQKTRRFATIQVVLYL